MKKQIIIDATSTRLWHCEKKFEYTVIDGWRSKELSTEIAFGMGFHKIVQTFEETGSIAEAICSGIKLFRDTPRESHTSKPYLDDLFLGLVGQYWYSSELRSADPFTTLRDNNNKPLVEVKFRLPFYSGRLADFHLAGTIDRICLNDRSNLLCVADYKTTSFWNQSEYLDDYALSGQLRFYLNAIRLMLKDAEPESVLYKFKEKEVRAFIDGVFLSPGTDKKGAVKFFRSDVFPISAASVLEYDGMLKEMCMQIDDSLDTNFFARNGILNGTCSTKSKCAFFNCCVHSDDDVVVSELLRRNFTQKSYNPLRFNEV